MWSCQSDGSSQRSSLIDAKRMGEFDDPMRQFKIEAVRRQMQKESD